MEKQIKTFADFWPFYVSQHLDGTNRACHVVGTTWGTILFLLFIFESLGYLSGYALVLSKVTYREMALDFFVVFTNLAYKYILPGIFFGYLWAWIGHFFFEKNKPATFQYPLWSFMGDFKMYWLTWRGQMDDEIVIAECLQMLPAASYSDWGKIYPAFKKLRTDSRPLREGKGLTEEEKVELHKWQRELKERSRLQQMERQRNRERVSDIYKR